MKNCFRYILICVVTLLITIMENGRFSLFLLAMELILPFFLYLQVRILSGKIRIEMPEQAVIPKKEETYVTIRVCNDAWLPISCLVLKMILEDVFDASKESRENICMIDAKSSTSVRIRVQADYAGKLLLYPGQVMVYDYLKLFPRRVKISCTAAELLVKPDRFGIGTAEDRMHGREQADGNDSVGNKSGDDSSEIFDTRSYQEGDALHRIHWKLSAKLDELLVKEYSASVEQGSYLLLDSCREDAEGWNHELFDKMATIMTSLSDMLLKRHIRHTILWYVSQEDKLYQKQITSDWEVYELVGELAKAGLCSERDAWNRVLYEVEHETGHADCLKLDTYLQIFWNHDRIASLKGDDMEKELRMLRIK